MEEAPDALEPGQPVILPVTLNRGFLYPDIRFAILSESDVYGVNRQKSRARARSGEKIVGLHRPARGRLRRPREPRHRPVHGHGAPGQRRNLPRLSAHPLSGLGQALRAHGSARSRAEVHRLRGRSAQAEPPLRRRMAAAEVQGQAVHPGHGGRSGQALRSARVRARPRLRAGHALAAGVRGQLPL